MHAMTANAEMRELIARAHAERNAAFRAMIVSLFSRKPVEAPMVAQPV